MKTNQELTILCLVSYNFLPARMGGQKGIASFLDFYAKKVNLVCVTTRSNEPAAADYEVLNILSDSSLRYANLLYFFTLRKLIKQRNITHLQIEHPYYGWLAILLKWFCGVQLIVHSHNMEGLRFKSIGKPWWRILAIYEKWVHRYADYNLFITDDDREYAVKQFRLKENKCITATYGIDWSAAPPAIEKGTAKKILQDKFDIPDNTIIMLFNGTFSYKPNQDGLRLILDRINPLLQSEGLNYRILICGKNIPDAINANIYPNVTIVGFVEDISVYFKGSDLFLNPVTDGGGIKTKLVEALGYDLTAVSFSNGAIGIPSGVAGKKLLVVKNDTAEEFSKAVIDVARDTATISEDYFQHFYWGNIIKRVITFLKKEE